MWTPLLWDPLGAALVDAVAPRPGERVLDACCGTGAAALPAAAAVAPGGHVDAVDLADGLVAAGRARAAGPVTFHTADVLTWPGTAHDVVTCAFGVFFLPDMDAGGAHLLGLLRPGGRIAVSTWQRGSVEPAIVPFAQAALAEHGADGLPFAPLWEREAAVRVDAPEKLAAWLRGIGAADPTVDVVRLDVPLTPELAWLLCVGSGARAMLTGLDDAAVARVRERYLATMTADVLPVAALVGTARRP